MKNVIDLLQPLRRFGVKLGPYVLMELLLPGGTLFALLLFLHRRSRQTAEILRPAGVTPCAGQHGLRRPCNSLARTHVT